MDFKSLPYNKLQSECKQRGLNARGKTLELIARLEQYEQNKNTVTIALEQNNSDNDDFSNSFFAAFDIELDNNDTPLIQPQPVATKPISITKVVKQPDVKRKPSQPVTIKTNRNITYEQLESFYNKGFICLNNNAHVRGIDARIMLSKLWARYPMIQQYLNDYESHSGILRVHYELQKEIIQSKKVVKKGRNTIPDTVEYGSKPVRKTVFVQNDRGNDLGLPSEKRSAYRSSLKHGIVDIETASSIYIDNLLLFPTQSRVTVTKLPSQSHSKTGKSKEHKQDSGYIGKTHNAKTKKNTGVKLASSVQSGINTNLFSNLFKIKGSDRPMQVEISNKGLVYLNQYMSNGTKIQTLIGKIGNLDSTGNYQIEYATNFKLVDNSTIHTHIQRLITKAKHHDVSFLMSTTEVQEKHVGQRKRRAIKRAEKREAARTQKINQGNIVSLVRK
jgi:hypothetical protein